MIKKFILLAILFTIFVNFIHSQKIPGIDAVKKYGHKLSPADIVDKIGIILSGIELTGGIASSIYYEVLNKPNNEPVFIIEEIEFNDKGFATKIEGHTEVPRTFRDFVLKGGLGMPVYEAVKPNEFGIIFGRKGNIAVRDGIIVRINPLKNAEIYEVLIGSELYDKISTASVLFQAYETIRIPYYENFIIELEGMILNSASKDEILKSIIEFKKTHKKMDEKELIANYLKVNKTYLNEIKKSNEKARNRIKESGKLMETIDDACSLQVFEITEIFLQITKDTASLFLDPFSAPERIIYYVRQNVPKNTDMTYAELKEIEKYDKYQMDQYNKNKKKNAELWKIIKEISKDL